MLVGSGVTVGIGVGWAVLGVGCVVAVVVGCGVLIGVLVAVRVSVCDGTGTLAGVVVILVNSRPRMYHLSSGIGYRALSGIGYQALLPPWASSLLTEGPCAACCLDRSPPFEGAG